jgi:hypothetical protein
MLQATGVRLLTFSHHCLSLCAQAMIAQVSHDHALLAERIARLTGAEGAARLEAALAHVRQQVAAELQAAEEAASEASWETASEAGVRCGGGGVLGCRCLVAAQGVRGSTHSHHHSMANSIMALLCI